MKTMSAEESASNEIENGVEPPVIAASDDAQPVVAASDAEPVVAASDDAQPLVTASDAEPVAAASDDAQPLVTASDAEPVVAASDDKQPVSEADLSVPKDETSLATASDEVQPVSEELPSTDDQDEASAEAMSGENKPTVELFVKAAPVDKEDKGPCPISQQWFMAFYILVEKGLINLRVTPINLDQPLPPGNYTSLEVGRRLPVAWVESGISPQSGEDISGIVADTNDAIENLIDLWQCPNLAQAKNNPAQREAERAGEDLYKHFNLMLKDGSSKPLATDLRKLDDYLGQNSHRYMLSDELCYADCMLMPKLQHIRVAGKCYKGFEIDFSLKNVWLYIESMYATQAFYLSCPADCDVLVHYMDKAKYPEGRKRPTLMSIQEKLCTVPDEVNSNRYEPMKSKDPAGNGEN